MCGVKKGRRRRREKNVIPAKGERFKEVECRS
jgi:hypothetical protein